MSRGIIRKITFFVSRKRNIVIELIFTENFGVSGYIFLSKDFNFGYGDI